MRYISALLLIASFCCLTKLSAQVIESSESFFKAREVNDWLIKDGQLLLATDVGIFVLDENAENLLEHWTVASAALPSNRVESMTLHPETQALYIGTYDIGAALQTPEGDWETMPYPEEMLNSFNPILTYTLEFDEDHRLLLGTNQGLWRLTGAESWENFNTNYFGGWIHSIWKILKAPTGEVYIGGNVIAQAQGDEFVIISPTEEMHTDLFAYSDIDLHLQSDGSLWAFTDIGVAGHLQDEEWELFIPFNSEPVLMLESRGFVFEDEAGALWKYTRNGFYFRYADGAWELVEEAETPFEFTEPEYVFANQEQWLGVRDGVLYELTNTAITPKQELSSWPWLHDNLWLFKNDQEGNLWAKTTPFQLLNLTTGEELDLTFLGEENYFSDYYFGTTGDLWLFGPDYSLIHVQDEEILAYYTPDNTIFTPGTYINDFTLAEDGTPWMLSGEGEVYTLQNGIWQEVIDFPVTSIVFSLQKGAGNHCYISRLVNSQIDLVELSLEEITYFDLPNNWTNSYFAAYAGQTPGELWTYNLITAELGLWNGAAWETMPFPTDWDLEDRPYYFEEREDRIWMMGAYQMAFYDGEQWTYYNLDDRLWDTSRIYYAGMDHLGDIWMTHQGIQVITHLTTNWGVTALDPIVETLTTENINVWPNPVTTSFRGDWEAGDIVSIWNNQGQQLQQILIADDQQELSAEHLPAGIYRLELKQNNDTRKNGTLIRLRNE